MYFLRHGLSEFNERYNALGVDPQTPDPSLTPLGVSQARAAGEFLKGQPITHIIASPYRRTLQTALAVQAVLNLPIMLDLRVREQNLYSCDIGSPPEILAKEFPQFDFTPLPPNWWHPELESKDLLHQRVQHFWGEWQELAHAPQTLVVSHFHTIAAFTGIQARNGMVLRRQPNHPPDQAQILLEP